MPKKRHKLVDDVVESRWTFGMTFQLVLGLLSALVFGIFYWGGHPISAGVTTLPPFIWAIFFLILCLRRRGFFRVFTLPFIAWLVLVILFDSYSTSLKHEVFAEESSEVNFLRVVSVNCLGEGIDVIEEAFEQKPDLILVQNAPDKEELDVLAKNQWGESGIVAEGPESSILVKGKLIDFPEPIAQTSSIVVELESVDPYVIVCSVNLRPPLDRFDFWNPAYWVDHSENHGYREAELERVMNHAEITTLGLPVILGGEFNENSNVGYTKQMDVYLNDTFEQAGFGWPATRKGKYPLQRSSQVWVKGFKALKSTVKPSKTDGCTFLVVDLVEATD